MAASASPLAGVKGAMSQIGWGYMGDGASGNVKDSFTHVKSTCTALVSTVEAQAVKIKTLETQNAALNTRVGALQTEQTKLLAMINSLATRIATLEGR